MAGEVELRQRPLEEGRACALDMAYGAHHVKTQHVVVRPAIVGDLYGIVENGGEAQAVQHRRPGGDRRRWRRGAKAVLLRAVVGHAAVQPAAPHRAQLEEVGPARQPTHLAHGERSGEIALHQKRCAAARRVDHAAFAAARSRLGRGCPSGRVGHVGAVAADAHLEASVGSQHPHVDRHRAHAVRPPRAAARQLSERGARGAMRGHVRLLVRYAAVLHHAARAAAQLRRWRALAHRRREGERAVRHRRTEHLRRARHDRVAQ
eukprot:7382849-Prymnesium_polylepis.1